MYILNLGSIENSNKPIYNITEKNDRSRRYERK